MADYKNILNLPRTNFSMKGNLSQKEPEIVKKWNTNNVYKIIRSSKKNKKKFFLHDGPPYANGNIHIGHAVNKILKDIIIKSKNMSGFDAPYTPSWDCHGLPIEHKIEIINKKQKQKIVLNNFQDQCRKYAKDQVHNQKKEFMRLGILGNWKNSYLTMDFENEANIIKTLYKMIRLGYIYRDFKPVNWCISCRSALAEAEVEYHYKTSESVFVKFKTTDNNTIKKIFNISNNLNNSIYIVIWTTTPWSLPANRAIAINPEFYYQLVQTKNQILIIAQKLVHTTMERCKITTWEILGTISGKLFKNIKFIHPFLNFCVPIIFSKHVTLELGTGAIHTAPEFGSDDYNISKKYNIDMTQTINKCGNFISDIHPDLNEINIFKSIEIIIKLLKKNDSLLKFEFFKHSYPHCWRHKTPIISRATPQWFIKMDHKNLRKNCIQQILKVNWIPSWGKEKMVKMMSTRPDWCISRQRMWGVPIPIFFHKKTGKLHPKLSLIVKNVIKDVKKQGISAWFNLNKDLLLEKDSKDYIQVTDIVDVWFESGSIMLSDIYKKFNHKNVSDIYIEGSDQHRGWFMSSLIISTAINSIAPYRTVITHGFTVDETGKKMSKSIGNTICPNEIIKIFGADILRLWVASTNYSKEVSISEKILKQTSDIYRKVRNTARFLLANLYDFNPNEEMVSSENMIILDRWAIGKTLDTQHKIIDSYNKYNFHDVIKHLIHFCSIDMSSFYLDIIKDRQYLTPSKNVSRKSCQSAMYLILNSLIRWIAPILSFTSEELWNHLPGKKSEFVFTEEWFDKLFNLNDHDLMNNQYWNELLTIKNEVNRILDDTRKNKKVGNSLESSITLYVDDNVEKKLNLLEDELKFLFLTSEIKIKNYISAPSYAVKSTLIPNFKTSIAKIEGIKCIRCWHIIPNLINIDINLKICTRCLANTIGSGEIRKFL
ncbi:MAG: isoleucine--tRNA ligase [Buchnera aphidicola (Schlechtendalia chinensis)]